MNKTLFIADTHFFQPEIQLIDGFSVNSESQIVEMWETTVGRDDTVFHLGDVGNPNNDLCDIFENLPGKKILIMGNHDFYGGMNARKWIEMGFDDVYEYPIVYEDFYILSHEPKYLNQFMPYANIHGHIHRNNMVTPGRVNKYINVSWPNIEKHGMVTFDEIKERFR